MIKMIAAVDEKLGIADDHGIPWRGLVPTDIEYYHDKIKTGTLLMGYGLYKELSKPYKDRVNYVATTKENPDLREGFEPVYDPREFLKEHKDDEVWNLGGALLFDSTLDMADELYLTRLDKDFNCTKFFPKFEDKFKRVSASEPITENGVTMTFEVWQRL